MCQEQTAIHVTSLVQVAVVQGIFRVYPVTLSTTTETIMEFVIKSVQVFTIQARIPVFLSVRPTPILWPT